MTVELTAKITRSLRLRHRNHRNEMDERAHQRA
jgi:hypothetical protein